MTAARILILCAILLLGGTTIKTHAADYKDANNAYQVGDYALARDLYLELLKKTESPELYYNLGNAHYRLDQPGHAALAWRRALRHSPGLGEARQNLRFLEKRSGYLTYYRSPMDSFAMRAHPSTWRGFAIISLLAAGLLLAVILVLRPPVWLSAFCALGAILLLANAIGCWWCARRTDSVRQHMDSLSIVITPESHARTAPAITASEVVYLPGGSEVQVIKKRGKWVYAELPVDARGWIPANDLERIVPE